MERQVSDLGALLLWQAEFSRLSMHASCPFAFHKPIAINIVTFPTYCIYVSENVCVAYVMEEI